MSVNRNGVGLTGSPGRGLRMLSAVLAVALLSGCKSPEERMRSERPAARPAASQTLTVGQSVEGRPIECRVFGDGRDVTLILASIHGNESVGTPLVQQLAEHLAAQPDLLKGRQVVLVPVVNPDGVARRTRHNVHGVDLNRNFPASNYERGSSHGSSSLSEPESLALHRVIGTYHPNRIVSIHQPANFGTACIDFDGPADKLARAMAQRCDLPVKRLGCRSGSLGAYAGLVLGVPIVTTELPNEASALAPPVLWRRYGPMLLAAITFAEPAQTDVAKTMR